MTKLKVEAVCLTAYKPFKNFTADPPRSIDKVQNKRRTHSPLGHLSPAQFKDQHARQGQQQLDLVYCQRRAPGLGSNLQCVHKQGVAT